MPLQGVSRRISFLTLTVIILSFAVSTSLAQSNNNNHPWSNSSLSPDERAAMVVKEMTIDEKLSMLHGTGMEGLSLMSPLAIHSNGGAGYVPAIRVWGFLQFRCRTPPTEFGTVGTMGATRRHCLPT